MLLKSHRLIGIIRVESPVLDLSGDDDDSTIGGLLAGFAQRSLLADAACLSRLSPSVAQGDSSFRSCGTSSIAANFAQLASDLEAELANLNDVLA